MSPSTSRFGVPLGTEDFDVGGRGRRGLGDQGSAWPGAEEVVEGGGREEANMETLLEGGGGPATNMVPNDAAKSTSLLQRDSLLTRGRQGMQTGASSCTAVVGGLGGAGGGCEDECMGRLGCVAASVGPKIKCSAPGTQEHSGSRRGKTLISLDSAAPSGTSQHDPERHVFRPQQDQRTSSTNAMSSTRQPGPDASPLTGHAHPPCKENVGKNLSHVAASPLIGATLLGGRSTQPAGNLTPATTGTKMPPRPWEPRVLLLALLLAASANGKSSATHTKFMIL